MTLEFDQLCPTINPIKAQGKLKVEPQDFIVTEHHDMSFTGSGEHLWFKVEKRDCNTAWVATQLASACKVPARQVGFAGLKDRHAITQQWFSVQLPKIKAIDDITAKLPNGIEILEHHYHQSKIKRGQLSFNAFDILIRDISGDRAQIEANISAIQQSGVPNYFGPQRFGHHMNNIQQAEDWFEGRIRVNNRNKRGILISAARSHLFNLMVAARIKQGIWDQSIDGDVMQLEGTHSWFPASAATTTEVSDRLAALDIHISAALWGEDAVQSSGECAVMEQQIAQQYPSFLKGFGAHRVKQDRRSVRVVPQQFSHQWQEDALRLSFNLKPGAYATGVIREVLKYHDLATQAKPQ